jgi:hypothetical protein
MAKYRNGKDDTVYTLCFWTSALCPTLDIQETVGVVDWSLRCKFNSGRVRPVTPGREGFPRRLMIRNVNLRYM